MKAKEKLRIILRNPENEHYIIPLLQYITDCDDIKDAKFIEIGGDIDEPFGFVMKKEGKTVFLAFDIDENFIINDVSLVTLNMALRHKLKHKRKKNRKSKEKNG